MQEENSKLVSKDNKIRLVIIDSKTGKYYFNTHLKFSDLKLNEETEGILNKMYKSLLKVFEPSGVFSIIIRYVGTSEKGDSYEVNIIPVKGTVHNKEDAVKISKIIAAANQLLSMELKKQKEEGEETQAAD